MLNVTIEWRPICISVASLLVVLVGLADTYPSYWIFPRLGPFEPEIIRPLILAGSVVLVVLNYSFTESFSKYRPKLKWLGFVFDVLILGVIAYALWRFTTDMLLAYMGGGLGNCRYCGFVLLFYRPLLAGNFQNRFL